MPRQERRPSGLESPFGENELIVSKTDPTGRLTYCNDIFQRVSGYAESELLGQPHSIIRHPDMPRCVFKLLWDTIGSGQEIFAYVLNMARNGDHYWVFAHVTPSFGSGGAIEGYHSNRRKPRADAVAKAESLYRELLSIERADGNRKDSMQAAYAALERKLRDTGMPYDAFVLSL
ncbi:MAG: PAS domain-containing protein [Alphaproteobacteria bacterium]|nr:PAS domain-containing protein [Alphaproteobacteria bacterium]